MKAEPDDYAPKLALADWLQEQDHAAERARGDYLRAALVCDRPSTTPAALARLHELWRNYPSWLGPLPAAGFRFWHYSARWGLLFPGIDGAHAGVEEGARGRGVGRVNVGRGAVVQPHERATGGSSIRR